MRKIQASEINVISLGTELLTTLMYANKSTVYWAFSKKRCPKMQYSLVTSILGRIFCSLPFSVTLLQLNLYKSDFGSFKLLGSTLDYWNYGLHSENLFHRLEMPYFIGTFFHDAF